MLFLYALVAIAAWLILLGAIQLLARFLARLEQRRKPSAPITVARPQTARSAELDVHGWIERQQLEYGPREGLSEKLAAKAKSFDPDVTGLGGLIVDDLIGRAPRMVPRKSWGGDAGWRSPNNKYSTRWAALMAREGIEVQGESRGVLVRFEINAAEWVPHPYNPPTWALNEFWGFAQYIADSREIFDLCQRWRDENSATLTKRLRERFDGSPVAIAASYKASDTSDLADVAFLVPEGSEEYLWRTHVWKGEARLGRLVAGCFPDTKREHSPPWLGHQRFDVFIPSLNVAIEYQGQQHYRAIPYFGGRKGYQRIRKLDRRKAEACEAAGVTLIEWRFDEPISVRVLRSKLEAQGIEWPDG